MIHIMLVNGCIMLVPWQLESLHGELNVFPLGLKPLHYWLKWTWCLHVICIHLICAVYINLCLLFTNILPSR